MDILGVGPLELLFILIIALIVLGPKDMVNAGRTIGRFLRKVVTSDTWRMVQNTSRDLRTLPNTLIRQAGLEEEAQMLQDELSMDGLQEEIQGELDKLKEVKEETEAELSDWTTPPGSTPVEDQAIVAAPDEPDADGTAPDGTSADEAPPDEAEPVDASADIAPPDATIAPPELTASQPEDTPVTEDTPAEDEPPEEEAEA
jgi:sec-independent protein translocase protein TatB